MSEVGGDVMIPEMEAKSDGVMGVNRKPDSKSEIVTNARAEYKRDSTEQSGHVASGGCKGKPNSYEEAELVADDGGRVKPGSRDKSEFVKSTEGVKKRDSLEQYEFIECSGYKGKPDSRKQSNFGTGSAGIGKPDSCVDSEDGWNSDTGKSMVYLDEEKLEVETNVLWEQQDSDIDQGWAWVVLLASWLTQVICGGAASSIGTFHLFLMDTFDGDPTMTAAIGSLFSGLCYCLGPIACLISDACSVRWCLVMGGLVATAGMVASSQATTFTWIFVTYGIVAGAGLGLTFTPSVVIPGYYFLKRRSMACGIGVTGYSFGIVVVPLILRALEERYGWRGAFLVMGGFTLNLCVCGLIMKPSVLEKSRGRLCRPNEAGMSNTSTKVKQVACASTICRKYRFLGNKRFWALFYVFFLSNVSMNIIFLYLPTYTDSLGATVAEMSLLYIVLGFFNVTSRVLVGLATNETDKRTSLDKTCLLFGSLGLQSIAILCFPLYSSSIVGRLSFAGIVGFYYGVQPSVTTPLTVDTVGLKRISPAVGMIMFGKGLGMIAGPPLATSLHNFTRSYGHAFIFGGVVNASAALFCLLTTLCVPYSEDFENGNPKNPEQMKLVIKDTEYSHSSADIAT